MYITNVSRIMDTYMTDVGGVHGNVADAGGVYGCIYSLCGWSLVIPMSLM